MISIRATAVKPQRPIYMVTLHITSPHLPSPPFDRALASLRAEGFELSRDPQAELGRAAQDIRNCFVALSSMVNDRLVVVTSPTTAFCLPGLAG